MKLFVLGAVLILVLHELTFNGPSWCAKAAPGLVLSSGLPVDINALLSDARQRPSSELLAQISHYYEQAHDFRRALEYLRRADEADAATDL